MGFKRTLRDLDDRVFGRDWPTWSWLPALTTLQALGVIVAAVIIAGVVPHIPLGGGFGVDPGNGLIGLSLAVAALSPKRVSKKRRGAG